MTKEEILAMKVGKKLDALVAENIMGLKIDWNVSLHYPQIRLDGTHFKSVDDYSTNISVACQVVERMEQDDWNWDASGRVGRKGVKPFKRFYFKPNKYDPVYLLSSIVWADGKELPEAICKAALLAKLEVGNA